MLICRDLKRSQFSLWLSLPILMFLSLSTAMAGLTIYAKYKDCDPLLTKRICSADQVRHHFNEIEVNATNNYNDHDKLFTRGQSGGCLWG